LTLNDHEIVIELLAEFFNLSFMVKGSVLKEIDVVVCLLDQFFFGNADKVDLLLVLVI